jgi:hypothetical protein
MEHSVQFNASVKQASSKKISLRNRMGKQHDIWIVGVWVTGGIGVMVTVGFGVAPPICDIKISSALLPTIFI